MKHSTLLIVSLMMLVPQAQCAQWSRSIEFGAVYITGNTEEDTLKLRSDVVGDYTRWRNSFHLDGLRSNKDNQLSAQKFYGSYKADYKFKDNQFAFARLSYEDDRFNGFDYQADVLLGYGRTLLENRSNMELNLEIGPGYRRSVLESGQSEGEAILGVAGSYSWQLSENAVFVQKLSSEAGSEAVISRSNTSLSSVIVGDLSMKVQMSVKYNSDAPLGTDSTDMESSITFVYKF